MKITKENVQSVIREAQCAANSAAREYLADYGEGMLNCGFAWVTIKPNRGILCNTLKEMKLGSAGWNGGLCVWNPSGVPVQDMSVLYAGALAFEDVLRKYGVNAQADCRLD